MIRPFMIFDCLGIAAPCASLSAGDEEPIFRDDFDRADSEEVGNNWSSKGSVILKDNAIKFQAKEEEFRPRTSVFSLCRRQEDSPCRFRWTGCENQKEPGLFTCSLETVRKCQRGWFTLMIFPRSRSQPGLGWG